MSEIEATLRAEIERLKAALRLVEYGSCDGCSSMHFAKDGRVEGHGGGGRNFCVICGAEAVVWNEDCTESHPEPHHPKCPIGEALK